MNLIIEYFKSSNEQRDIEYKYCLNENIKNKSIQKIWVFISDESILDIQSDKIEIIKIQSRPTYQFIIDWSSQNLKDEICIISNGDIFYNDTLSLLDSNLDNTFVALTRWDLLQNNGQWVAQFYNHPWRGNITTGQLSQDCWIYKSPIKTDDRLNFTMGKPGCDNRIVQIYHELGYNVKNPSLQIQSLHLHTTNYRTYNHTDMVMGPYLLVEPTNDIKLDSQKQTIPHF